VDIDMALEEHQQLHALLLSGTCVLEIIAARNQMAAQWDESRPLTDAEKKRLRWQRKNKRKRERKRTAADGVAAAAGQQKRQGAFVHISWELHPSVNSVKLARGPCDARSHRNHGNFPSRWHLQQHMCILSKFYPLPFGT